MKCGWRDPLAPEEELGECFHEQECVYSADGDDGLRYCTDNSKQFERYYPHNENITDKKIKEGVDY